VATKPRFSVIDRIMNEVALYGGIPLRRGSILKLAKEHLGADAKEPFGAQYFALHGLAVEMEPWTLEAARQLMDDSK
jgi:hypothetical protein